MKVKEVIEKLKAFNQEAEFIVSCDEVESCNKVPPMLNFAPVISFKTNPRKNIPSITNNIFFIIIFFKNPLFLNSNILLSPLNNQHL